MGKATEETGLSYDALYKSRISLMKGIFEIQNKLNSLKFMKDDIFDETVNIIIQCEEITKSNAADVLQEMGDYTQCDKH